HKKPAFLIFFNGLSLLSTFLVLLGFFLASLFFLLMPMLIDFLGQNGRLQGLAHTFQFIVKTSHLDMPLMALSATASTQAGNTRQHDENGHNNGCSLG